MINAPAEAVAALLFDFDSYASWNKFMPRISGDRAVGQKLSVRIEPPGSSGISMTPTVLEAGPLSIRWIGHFLIAGIFDGEHSLRIEPRGANACVMTQEERFSGLLIPFMGKLLANTESGFQAMNLALKQRAEKAAAV